MFSCCSSADDEPQITVNPSASWEAAPKPADSAPSVVQKVAPAEPPRQPSPYTWDASFTRKDVTSGDWLGLVLDLSDDTTCLVKEVDGGLAADYNAAKPSNPIQMFDRIVKVNGTTGSAKWIAAELGSQQSSFTLTLMRPQERNIHLESSTDLGVMVKYKKGSMGFWAHAIEAGKMQVWNQEHPDQQLKVFDRVVAINGKFGMGPDLLAALKTDGPVQLTVMSYSRDES
eukprot:TRINITY_DN47819_c0_g1_i1.p1 TRINITY_DN47819_c0_g1~~TRINITY_DN47819_c0_g1_i1.p1  ORF type:complete len:229 (+),score=45.36 TRINITY_DN47819_c0_g1_i1:129-815(+)